MKTREISHPRVTSAEIQRSWDLLVTIIMTEMTELQQEVIHKHLL